MNIFTKILNIRTRWHSLRLEKDYFHSIEQHYFQQEGSMELINSAHGLGLGYNEGLR